MHQLLSLFGGVYRAGRAASAPLSRPHGSDSREGGHSTEDPLPTFVAEIEARAHDLNHLPRMYSAEQIDEMLPTITAAPEIDHAENYIAAGLRPPRMDASLRK